jgi:hypothetical protein
MIATIFGSKVPEGVTPITAERVRGRLMELYAAQRMDLRKTVINGIGASRNYAMTASRSRSAIFSGGDERQRAIRYADREYGEFDEIELEPYLILW